MLTKSNTRGRPRIEPKSDVAHYRLGQLYREMNKLELATMELTRYQELAHLHQEELKRNRSTIKQFVINDKSESPTFNSNVTVVNRFE